MSRWWVFIQERFEPVSHLLMIGSFSAAHAVAAARGAGQSAAAWATWRSLLIILPGVVAFFFLLRLYDEIKDDEHDREVNPDRPLARGLVSRKELKFGMIVCLAIVFASFGAAGWPAWCTVAAAVAYSWLMYCEFFIGDWLRPKLTTYAVSHTAVSVLLSAAMLSAMTGCYPWVLTTQHWLFALNSWLLFNAFEFGRKTFLSNEERDKAPSYSKIVSRYGAVAMVLTMAAGSLALLWGYFPPSRTAPVSVPQTAMAALAAILAAVGLAYAVLDRQPWGKAYRGLCSAYLVLMCMVFALGPFLS